MGHHLTVNDNAGFIDIEKNEELETRVSTNDDSGHDDQPSLDEELWVVEDCLATGDFNVDVLVKVLVLLPEIQRV